jgi:hypothetical protein
LVAGANRPRAATKMAIRADEIRGFISLRFNHRANLSS